MRLFRIVRSALVLALLGGVMPCAAQGNPVVFEDGFDCRSWYRDVDGDQYGDPNDAVLTCTPDPGYVYDGTDCNDGDAAINPGVFDLPDDSAIDANCDGIDGTEVAAVFVATTGTINSSCSKLQPCSSLAVGILRVTAQRTHLYMQAGLYPEGSLTLPSVSIWGGYDTAWQRSDFLGPGHLVEVRPVASVSPAPAVVGFKITAGRDISMADLMVVGPNATSDGHSSYVFHVLGSILRLHGVIVDQGDAIAGSVGAAGSDAITTDPPTGNTVGGNAAIVFEICDDSTRGVGGTRGTNNCPSSVRDPDGGAGGPGGTVDTECDGGFPDFTARPGTAGSPADFSPAVPGDGGPPGAACADGSDGIDGTVFNGFAGARLAGATLTLGTEFWVGNPGGNGGQGENGTGGGGGGGGGACDSGSDAYGAGGGGGGAGGCAAASGGFSGGTGGTGGGSSIGVYLGTGATGFIDDCEFQRGIAGAGGAGGTGGRGQSGASGRNGGTDTGSAGAGGRGGDGGHGGHGGGGAGGQGGRSLGIVRLTTVTLTQSGNTFSGGSAGAGGAGGLHAPSAPAIERDGNNGQSGMVGSLGTILTCTTSSC